jgi:hypothetical protein
VVIFLYDVQEGYNVAGYDPFGDDHTARETWRRALGIYARVRRFRTDGSVCTEQGDTRYWDYARNVDAGSVAGYWARVLYDLRAARGDSRRWAVVARRVWTA